MRHVNRIVRQGIGVVVAAWLGLVFVAPAVAGDCPFDWRPEEAVPGIVTAVTCLVTWDPDGPGAQQPLLVAGGRTKIAENVFVGGVAAWDGTSWQALGSGMNERVEALAVYNGALIAGGRFTLAGGNAASCIASWDGAAWHEVGNGVSQSAEPRVLALLPYGNQLIVGGAFTSAGGASGFDRVAAWNGQTWQTMGGGMNGRVHALVEYSGAIVAGGIFTIASATPADRVARWTGAAWEPLGLGISGNPSSVNSLGVYEGQLVAGGNFSINDGAQANSIARWDGATWNQLGSGMAGNDPTVNAIAVYDGKLIAGGRFTVAGGQAASYVAQWDGMNWQPMGSSLNRRVEAMTLYGGDLIAGGFFSADGEDHARVARWGPACQRGDMNCDSTLDATDVSLFANALLAAPALSICESYTANVNADLLPDGSPKVDGLDVTAFVEELLGS